MSSKLSKKRQWGHILHVKCFYLIIVAERELHINLNILSETKAQVGAEKAYECSGRTIPHRRKRNIYTNWNSDSIYVNNINSIERKVNDSLRQGSRGALVDAWTDVLASQPWIISTSAMCRSRQSLIQTKVNTALITSSNILTYWVQCDKPIDIDDTRPGTRGGKYLKSATSCTENTCSTGFLYS